MDKNCKYYKADCYQSKSVVGTGIGVFILETLYNDNNKPFEEILYEQIRGGHYDRLDRFVTEYVLLKQKDIWGKSEKEHAPIGFYKNHMELNLLDEHC